MHNFFFSFTHPVLYTSATIPDFSPSPTVSALQYIEEKLADVEDLSNDLCHEFYKILSELFHDSVPAQEVADFTTSMEDVRDEETTLWTLWSEIWRISKRDNRTVCLIMALSVSV